MRLEKIVELAQKEKRTFTPQPFGNEIGITENGDFYCKMPSTAKTPYTLTAEHFSIQTWELTPAPKTSKSVDQQFEDVIAPLRAFVCDLAKEKLL